MSENETIVEENPNEATQGELRGCRGLITGIGDGIKKRVSNTGTGIGGRFSDGKEAVRNGLDTSADFVVSVLKKDEDGNRRNVKADLGVIGKAGYGKLDGISYIPETLAGGYALVSGLNLARKDVEYETKFRRRARKIAGYALAGIGAAAVIHGGVEGYKANFSKNGETE